MRSEVLHDGPDQAVVEDYRKYSLTLGSRVQALVPGDHEIIGTATEVDAVGHLITDTEVVTVSAGDITHLRPAD